MSGWAGLILALIRCLSSLTNWVRERQLLKAGEATAVSSALQQLVKDIEDNEKTRDEVRRRNSGVPSGGKLPDDGYRRD